MNSIGGGRGQDRPLIRNISAVVLYVMPRIILSKRLILAPPAHYTIRNFFPMAKKKVNK